MTSPFLAECSEALMLSGAYAHRFLNELRSRRMDPAGAKAFAVQWYKAATAHKRAFPGLIYNTSDDELRLQLIEILREEYGFGDRGKVHARILERFLYALGIEPCDAKRMTTHKDVESFSSTVDELWSRGDEVKAFGVHFALEFLAANMHKAFFSGVQTLDLEPGAIEYFKLHSVAEEEHARFAEKGVEYLARSESNKAKLMEGMREGAAIVAILLDGLGASYAEAIQ